MRPSPMTCFSHRSWQRPRGFAAVTKVLLGGLCVHTLGGPDLIRGALMERGSGWSSDQTLSRLLAWEKQTVLDPTAARRQTLLTPRELGTGPQAAAKPAAQATAPRQLWEAASREPHYAAARILTHGNRKTVGGCCFGLPFAGVAQQWATPRLCQDHNC